MELCPRAWGALRAAIESEDALKEENLTTDEHR